MYLLRAENGSRTKGSESQILKRFSSLSFILMVLRERREVAHQLIIISITLGWARQQTNF